MKSYFRIILLALITAALAACLTVSSLAAGNYMIDQAGLLSSAELSALNGMLQRNSESCGADIVVLTVNGITYNGEEIDYDSISDAGYEIALTDFADDYYDYNGFSDDGILLLIDIGGRGWATSTKGRAISALTDDILYSIENKIVGNLSSGKYALAITSFAGDCEWYIDYYNVNGRAYGTHGGSSPSYEERDRSIGAFLLSPVRIIIPVVSGLLFSLIKLGAEKRKLTSVLPVNHANAYLIENSFELEDSQDVFLSSDVSRTRRSDSDDGGRRGGGGGSSSHISSSGSSHGGHSGRF